MLLCDTILEAARLADRPADLGVPASAAASPLLRAQFVAIAELAGGIGKAVRYVIDDDVVRAAVDVAASRPSSIRDAFPVARALHPFMWVEWFDGPRHEARREAGILSTGERASAAAHRVGCLVRSDAEGRRGDMLFAWMHQDQVTGQAPRIPNVCPLAISFDFDPHPLPTRAQEGVTDMHRRWQSSPAEIEALGAIELTASISTTSGGAAVTKALSEIVGKKAAADYLVQGRRDLDGEYLHMLAVLLLLQAPNATSLREEDRTRLNRARAKAGKPSLLDHRIAYMRIGSRLAREGTAGGGGGAGGHRRAHIVRGHFVTRQQTVFWRRSHLRGSGSPPTKTVKVSV